MRRRGPLDRLVRLDTRLFRAVAAHHTPWLDRALPPLSRAADNSRLWMGAAAVLAAVGHRSGKRAALRGAGSVALTSAVVNQGVKRLVRRPRPDLRAVPLARRLPAQPLTTSFPSGHAASAAAFTTGVAIEKPKVVAPVALAAAAVAYSRIYVGVHYPFDVAAGAAAGAGVALLTRRLWPALPPESARIAEAGESVRLPAADGAGVAVVVNPDSGSRLNGTGDGLAEAMPGADVRDVGGADELAAALDRAAHGCDVLGVCGGDGTVAVAAGVALDRGLPLLVLPGGTLNHLARDLALERREDALDALRAGHGRRVDVAAVDGRPFVNGVGLGAYPEMLDAREPLEARIGRWPAHLLALMLTLVRARPLDVRVDGRPRRLWIGFVGNCRHEPEGFAPSWRPRLDDGRLDVRLLLADVRFSRVRLLGALLTGRLQRSPAFERFEAPSLELESDEPLRLAADGDPLDAGRRATIEKRGQVAVYAA